MERRLKIWLRNLVLARRSLLSQEEIRTKSEAICKRLLELPAWREAESFMIYVSIGNEVRTEGLLREVLACGKRLMVPYCVREERRLIASEIYHYPGDLSPRTWGILEPRPDTLRPVDPQNIDLCVVPGVAFDTHGNRMGYGAGYYDGFLPGLRRKALKIALAFEIQIVDTVFSTERDVPVDLIITEARIIRPGFKTAIFSR